MVIKLNIISENKINIDEWRYILPDFPNYQINRE